MRQPGDTRERRRATVVVASLVLVLLGIVGLAPSSPAAAQGVRCTDYAPPAPTVGSPASLTAPSSFTKGSPVTISGTAVPGATVVLTLKGPGISDVPLGSGTAGEDGAFSITVTLPSDLAPGTYQIVAAAAECPQPMTVTITVTGPGGTTTTTSVTTTTVAGGSATTTTEKGAGGTVTTTSLASVQADVGSEVLGATESRATGGSLAFSDDKPLAFTGGEARPFIVAAIAAVALGALLVGLARRRARA